MLRSEKKRALKKKKKKKGGGRRVAQENDAIETERSLKNTRKRD
jgi:hypothetical protein